MKLILSLSLVCAIYTQAAQTTNSATFPPPPPPIAGEPQPWEFSKGEWSAESFYVARFSGDFDKAQQGFGFGVGYSLTENVVLSVLTTSYLEQPQFLNELAGRVTYRVAVPFIPIKHLAAYGFGEGGGNLQSGDGFGGAGAGLEYRILKNLDFKVESGVRLSTEWTPSVGILAGLGFHF